MLEKLFLKVRLQLLIDCLHGAIANLSYCKTVHFWLFWEAETQNWKSSGTQVTRILFCKNT